MTELGEIIATHICTSSFECIKQVYFYFIELVSIVTIFHDFYIILLALVTNILLGLLPI